MRFDTDSLWKYVWLLKFIEGQANEYTSNHGFKPLSPALTLVPVSTYHGKWVLIQPIIPKEGSTPARMKASTNVSTNSQLMGDAGYTPFFIWFCLIHIKQKLILGSRLSSSHTNGFIWWLAWGWGEMWIWGFKKFKLFEGSFFHDFNLIHFP